MPKKDNEGLAIAETEVPAEEDSMAAKLAALGAKLVAVAGNKAEREAVIKEVETTLANVKVKDFPDLADSEIVQSFVEMFKPADMRPGETRHRGTLAEVQRDWSIEDINREIKAGRMGLHRFLPTESLPITWNGVCIQVVADGTEVELPDCFFDIYRDHMKAVQQAVKNERYMLGHSDDPPDLAWRTAEAENVRAWSLQGKPHGKPSGTLSTGAIILTPGEESA